MPSSALLQARVRKHFTTFPEDRLIEEPASIQLRIVLLGLLQFRHPS
jgi:hypothetical protein